MTADLLLQALADAERTIADDGDAWLTVPDLIERTGLDGYDVRDTIDALVASGRVFALIHRPPGTYGRRFLRLVPR